MLRALLSRVEIKTLKLQVFSSSFHEDDHLVILRGYFGRFDVKAKFLNVWELFIIIGDDLSELVEFIGDCFIDDYALIYTTHGHDSQDLQIVEELDYLSFLEEGVD